MNKTSKECLRHIISITDEEEGTKNYPFSRKGKKRIALEGKNKGFCLVNADVVIADGTKYDAVLMICEMDHGEHYETWFLLDNVIVCQSDYNFPKGLGKTQEQVFPYKYKYRAPLDLDEDFHVGADGWSK